MQRAELIIRVPVIYNRPSLFCERRSISDEFHYWNVTEKITSFIFANVDCYGILPYDLPSQEAFCEVIKNAYDAFAAKGLKYGDELILKTVVEEKDGKILVKIKDNGTGFIGHEKSEIFAMAAVKRAEKGAGYFGHKGNGLRLFIENMQYKPRGHIQLKNRKTAGAVIELVFDSSHFKKYVA